MRIYTWDGIAIIDVHMTGKKILGVPVVADKDSMVSYIQKNWVDEVFLQSFRGDGYTE